MRACETEGQVVLLDLRAGRYLGVAQSPALAETIADWPSSASVVPLRHASADFQATVGPLLAKGLLSDRHSDRETPRNLPAPAISLNALDGARANRTGLFSAGRFVVATVRTASALRYRTLESIARALIKRRDRRSGGVAAISPDQLLGPVGAYERLRPLVFSARQQCLQDSLTMIEFLARENMFPNWVIGVRVRPFAAHSWVQAGEAVLNDQHDHVRQFRPILIA